jgi:hypothetical protein
MTYREWPPLVFLRFYVQPPQLGGHGLFAESSTKRRPHIDVNTPPAIERIE